jgi:hypothetical protein
MAVLNGINGAPVVSIAPAQAQQATAPNMAPSAPVPTVIDGTPVRVAVLCLSAAAGLVALHAAGFRFNVGVSG